jgi:L-asparaginase II
MNPVLVEVLRGGVVESRHRGAAVIVDAAGQIVFAVGDVTRPVFPRSAVKPLQALALVAGGAADRFGFEAAEIALACGSHGGTPAHVAVALAMLTKCGSTAADLECGAHWPLDEAVTRDLAGRGEQPTALHNNCSGKHAGFITIARAREIDPTGYGQPDHPIMHDVTAVLGDLTATRIAEAPVGVDGCSIPAFALPLQALARGFARFGGGGLPADLATAATRIRAAVASAPQMIAGEGRFDTEVAVYGGGNVLAKSGAEGVACATVAPLGLGLAVKIDDGAGRAAQVVMARLLDCFCNGITASNALRALFARHGRPVLKNWNGQDVGLLRPSAAVPWPSPPPG